MNKQTKTTKIDNPTAKKMQLIVEDYFKNVLGLPCPDFTINLKNATQPNSKEPTEEEINRVVELLKGEEIITPFPNNSDINN